MQYGYLRKVVIKDCVFIVDLGLGTYLTVQFSSDICSKSCNLDTIQTMFASHLMTHN